MIDCRQCKYSERAYHDTLCTRLLGPPVSVDWRRDDRNECKREGKLFEPKTERKEAERWHPY